MFGEKSPLVRRPRRKWLRLQHNHARHKIKLDRMEWNISSLQLIMLNRESSVGRRASRVKCDFKIIKLVWFRSRAEPEAGRRPIDSSARLLPKCSRCGYRSR